MLLLFFSLLRISYQTDIYLVQIFDYNNIQENQIEEYKLDYFRFTIFKSLVNILTEPFTIENEDGSFVHILNILCSKLTNFYKKGLLFIEKTDFRYKFISELGSHQFVRVFASGFLEKISYRDNSITENIQQEVVIFCNMLTDFFIFNKNLSLDDLYEIIDLHLKISSYLSMSQDERLFNLDCHKKIIYAKNVDFQNRPNYFVLRFNTFDDIISYNPIFERNQSVFILDVCMLYRVFSLFNNCLKSKVVNLEDIISEFENIFKNVIFLVWNRAEKNEVMLFDLLICSMNNIFMFKQFNKTNLPMDIFYIFLVELGNVFETIFSVNFCLRGKDISEFYNSKRIKIEKNNFYRSIRQNLESLDYLIERKIKAKNSSKSKKGRNKNHERSVENKGVNSHGVDAMKKDKKKGERNKTPDFSEFNNAEKNNKSNGDNNSKQSNGNTKLEKPKEGNKSKGDNNPYNSNGSSKLEKPKEGNKSNGDINSKKFNGNTKSEKPKEGNKYSGNNNPDRSKGDIKSEKIKEGNKSGGNNNPDRSKGSTKLETPKEGNKSGGNNNPDNSKGNINPDKSKEGNKLLSEKEKVDSTHKDNGKNGDTKTLLFEKKQSIENSRSDLLNTKRGINTKSSIPQEKQVSGEESKNPKNGQNNKRNSASGLFNKKDTSDFRLGEQPLNKPKTGNQTAFSSFRPNSKSEQSGNATRCIQGINKPFNPFFQQYTKSEQSESTKTTLSNPVSLPWTRPQQLESTKTTVHSAISFKPKQLENTSNSSQSNSYSSILKNSPISKSQQTGNNTTFHDNQQTSQMTYSSNSISQQSDNKNLQSLSSKKISKLRNTYKDQFNFLIDKSNRDKNLSIYNSNSISDDLIQKHKEKLSKIFHGRNFHDGPRINSVFVNGRYWGIEFRTL